MNIKIVILFSTAFYMFVLGCSPAAAQKVWFRRGEHACGARVPQDKPFFEAVKSGDASSVRRFLRNGVDPNLTDDCNIGAVNYAAHRIDSLELLKIFVDAGADVNFIDGFERQPLIFWVLDSSGESPSKIREPLKLLLEAGADVNLRGKLKQSALISAVLNDQPEIVRLLVNSGADLNFKDDADRTAYSYAAENGSGELKKLLIEAGADPQIGTDEYLQTYGENAFFQAAADGRTDVVESFLARGTPVNAVNAGKMTALMRAAGESTVEILLRNGAQVDLRDRAGFTALIWAAAFNRKEIVKQLIAAGADVNARTADGKTALGLATAPEVKALLINAGARLE